jgi:hypothetical protein
MKPNLCPVCELVYEGTHCEVCGYTQLSVWELDEIQEQERGDRAHDKRKDDAVLYRDEL